MHRRKRIVFLYSELASYFLVCLEEFQRRTKAEIHVVHWPINEEAPFEFNLDIEHTTFHSKIKLSLAELKALVKSIDPHLIYCSGWIDKDYLEVCRQYKSLIPVVSGFDTPWQGNVKQYMRTLTSSFTIKKYFSHLWIAGEPQLKYAQKLGFKNTQVITGVYAADVNHFNAIYDRIREKKFTKTPKRFIFVGRYLEFKGIFDLWKAFIAANEQCGNSWQLWCLGTGALWSKRIQHPQIKHLGFVQPSEMEKYLEQTTVFVLPSRFEPWAVALHEFCAAGFPVICSDKVGASTAFLKENENGFSFRAGNVDELTQCFLKFMRMPVTELAQFGAKSHELAQNITPATWSNTLAALL